MVAGLMIALCAIGAAVCTAQDDFEWSWEEEVAEADAPAVEELPVPEGPGVMIDEPEPVELLPAEEDFVWTWEEPSEEVLTATEVIAPAEDGASPATGQASAPGIDVGAYEDLLQENLRLRREVASVAQNEEATREENERMASEIRDLERRMQEFAGLMKGMDEGVEPALVDLERVSQIENQLAEALREKARLESELQALRSAQAQGEAASPAPKAGSELFRQIEDENRALKQKLLEVEQARQEAAEAREKMSQRDQKHDEDIAREREKQKELKEELSRVESSKKDHRQTLERLLQTIPQLEKELEELRRNLQIKDGLVSDKDQELQSLRMELERREQRLIKAERMAKLMEKTREEVRVVSEKEKRDMHYNMAAVYVKEGRPREAEQEYLRALQLDPTDADVHYNLAILYEDEFNNDRKAARHFRRYLKLAPNAEDAEVVKSWLMEIGML